MKAFVLYYLIHETILRIEITYKKILCIRAAQLPGDIFLKDLVYFATRVPDTSDTSPTRTTRVRHECYTNDTRATRVKNVDFDKGTNENIFPHPYISYMANERLQGEEQFHSKNYLLEMPRSHAKIRLKSAPQKLNFVMAKAISKSYILDCSCKYPCTFPHSYA